MNGCCNVREYLLTEINKAFGTIEFYDGEGMHIDKYKYSTSFKTSKNFYDRVWHVLNERKIPFITLKLDNQVHIATGFVKGLDDYLKEYKYCKSMKYLSKLLGWDDKVFYLHDSDNEVILGFKLDSKEFLGFLYP